MRSKFSSAIFSVNANFSMGAIFGSANLKINANFSVSVIFSSANFSVNSNFSMNTHFCVNIMLRLSMSACSGRNADCSMNANFLA